MRTDSAAASRPIIRAASGITAIDRTAWDAVANPGWPCSAPLTSPAIDGRAAYNPFVSHDFLSSLEESGSAAARTGWEPHHLILEEGSRITGALPAYLKTHSMGEYVFDHGWADAYQRAGGRYYPKLQASVPFTPVTGPRLLVGGGDGADERRLRLASGALEFARHRHLSSVHVTFLPEAETATFEEAGYLTRIDQQFHFVSDGYADFDGFLDSLASRKRKAIRKERREAVGDDITIDCLTGRDITEDAWDAFFAFYMDTGSRKWGQPYLTRHFFSLIGERMADRTLLVMAKRAGRYIAGAINFIGSDTLYGRNWGCIEQHPFLHFEVCYYQAIEWALAHGLTRVEAGAQGEHKLARGYMPAPTYSAHWIADARFRAAVAGFLRRERAQTEHDIEAFAAQSPFRHEID
ncbi:MAG: GNAT family N-acetyltransferase [Bauldia sp.]